MGIWKRFVAWMNRGPDCAYCGKEMKRHEGLGAGFWLCECDAGGIDAPMPTGERA